MHISQLLEADAAPPFYSTQIQLIVVQVHKTKKKCLMWGVFFISAADNWRTFVKEVKR